MAKDHCVLCGKELSFFSRSSITVYSTHQTACTSCQEQYDRAKPEEKAVLLQRILRSPDLGDRDFVLKNRRFREEEAARIKAAEKERQQMLLQRPISQRAILTCCERAMTPLGVSEFQMGREGFFLDTHMFEGSMRFAIFRCDCCGQLKFFDPKFIEHA